MALTATTLVSAIDKNATTLVLTSTSGFAAGQLVQIDDEYMVVSSVPYSGTINVFKRGDQGTAAKAHAVLAPVVTSASVYDFPGIPPGSVNEIPPFFPDVRTYGASGAITIPDKDGVAILNKAGVGAMTLADPTKAQDGRRLTINSSTAQAHTVTNTTGFNAGGSGGDVATFGGAIGDGLEVMAVNGVWNVLDKTNVTIA